MADGCRLASGQSLAQLQAQVSQFADGRARQRAIGALARELGADVRNAFATLTAPDGNAWAPRKNRRARGRLLDVSGAMKRSASRVLLFGSTVRIVLVPYAGFHQDGAPRAHLPARPFFPADPMPQAFVSRYERAMLDAVERR